MIAATRSRTSRPPRRAARPRLEPLEPRLPLAVTAGVVNQTLTVVGTPGPDRISILPTELPGTVRVVAGGKVLGRFGPVTAIHVDAGAGNDSVTVDPRITLPATLDGGPGNDRLRAGFGPTTLLGGGGNDVLVGAADRDVFDAGSGHVRRVFLKTLGVVQVGPSASGAGLRSLSGAYTLMPLQVAGPAVVGAADLSNGRIARQLINDYNGGQPVALTNATADAANALARMLGYMAPVAFPAGVRRAELVSFRKVDQGGRTVFSTSILPPTAHVRVAPADRKAGRQLDAQGVDKYMQQIFSAIPAAPATPAVGGPQQDLLAIANAYIQTSLFRDDTGTQLQVTNTIYDVRSFTNQADFYYVSQDIIATAGVSTTPLGTVGILNTWAPQIPNGPGLTMLLPSPQSNPGTTSYTSSVGWSIGGSIGFNQAQGFNASISGGVTVTNSTTVQVPPISIQNNANPAQATTGWFYIFNSTPAQGSSTTFTQQWIWEAPFTYYDFEKYNNMFLFQYFIGYATPGSPTFTGGGNYGAGASVPMGELTQLSAPIVNANNPTSVAVGHTFIINGLNFYPSLVRSVLIGGKKVDPANWVALNFQQIEVVAPDMPGQALPVVVTTTQGVSNFDKTITITASAPRRIARRPRGPAINLAPPARNRAASSTVVLPQLFGPAGTTSELGYPSGPRKSRSSRSIPRKSRIVSDVIPILGR